MVFLGSFNAINGLVGTIIGMVIGRKVQGMPGRHWNEEEERKLAEMVVVGMFTEPYGRGLR